MDLLRCGWLVVLALRGAGPRNLIPAISRRNGSARALTTITARKVRDDAAAVAAVARCTISRVVNQSAIYNERAVSKRPGSSDVIYLRMKTIISPIARAYLFTRWTFVLPYGTRLFRFGSIRRMARLSEWLSIRMICAWRFIYIRRRKIYAPRDNFEISIAITLTSWAINRCDVKVRFRDV